MTVDLEFHPEALREWRNLDQSVRRRLKKKLVRRLGNPAVPAARLSGRLTNCYKIKDSVSGYRLIYLFEASDFLVFVLAVGKRESSGVYQIADGRRG